MSYAIVLLGFQDSTALNAIFSEQPEISTITDCGCDIGRAAGLVNQCLSTLFAVSTELPRREIERFTSQLLPAWRRGVLIGTRDDELAAWGLNTLQYAAYLAPAPDRAHLSAMFRHLDYWRDHWLGVADRA